MSGSFRLSVREKTEIVKWYAIYQNAAKVARQFHQCFGRTPRTSKNMLSLVKKFDETESLEDKSPSGRPRSISTDENKERILEAYVENPTTTKRRASLELNLSRSSLRRITHPAISKCFKNKSSQPSREKWI